MSKKVIKIEMSVVTRMLLPSNPLCSSKCSIEIANQILSVLVLQEEEVCH